MVEKILLTIVTVCLTLGAVYAYGLITKYRILYQSTSEQRDELLERAMRAESERDKANSSVEFFKMHMTNLSKQPVIATLSDAQAANLTEAIFRYLADREKDLMN